MGPEYNEWLCDSDLTNAAELVQEYLDTLEPQDKPAAHVGRPTLPTASESRVSPSGTTVAKVPAKKRQTSQAECMCRCYYAKR